MQANIHLIYNEMYAYVSEISKNSTLLDFIYLLIDKYKLFSIENDIVGDNNFNIKGSVLDTLGFSSEYFVKDFKLIKYKDYITKDDPVKGKLSINFKIQLIARLKDVEDDLKCTEEILKCKRQELLYALTSNQSIIKQLEKEISIYENQICNNHIIINNIKTSIDNISIPQELFVSSDLKLDILLEVIKHMISNNC